MLENSADSTKQNLCHLVEKNWRKGDIVNSRKLVLDFILLQMEKRREKTKTLEEKNEKIEEKKRK